MAVGKLLPHPLILRVDLIKNEGACGRCPLCTFGFLLFEILISKLSLYITGKHLYFIHITSFTNNLFKIVITICFPLKFINHIL